ncbi:MAG: glutathione S-transferase family protein [Arenibacterium sp.]
MTALLYHCPFNCSLAVRFAAAEGAVPLEIEQVDFKSKALASGGSLLDINPLGQVSTMRLDSGDVLSETLACLLWVQSHSQNAFQVRPQDPAYFQMVRWLSFTSTELHKQILRVVFYPEATAPVKDNFRALAPARYDLVETHLADNRFLVGDRFTAADAYLVWYLVLADRARVPIDRHPRLGAYFATMTARPDIAALIQDDTRRQGNEGRK